MISRPLAGMPYYLRRWREARHPADVPEKYRRNLGTELPQALTQEVMARLACVSKRHYGRFEATGRCGISLVEAVVDILGCDQHQTAAIHRWTGREPPAPPPRHEIPPDLRACLDDLPGPSFFVSTSHYDMLAHNAALARTFPTLAEADNALLWVINPPTAEVRASMIDWEHSWARPTAALLHQLLVEAAKHPRTKEIYASLDDDPQSRAQWSAHAKFQSSAAGDTRPVLLPEISPVPILLKVQTFIPEAAKDVILVTGRLIPR